MDSKKKKKKSYEHYENTINALAAYTYTTRTNKLRCSVTTFPAELRVIVLCTLKTNSKSGTPPSRGVRARACVCTLS